MEGTNRAIDNLHHLSEKDRDRWQRETDTNTLRSNKANNSYANITARNNKQS